MTTTTKQVPISATLVITDVEVSVAALFDESGDALETTLESSHIVVNNLSIGPVECQLNGGAWEPLVQGGRLMVDADMSTDTVKFRKARHPTTSTAAALLVQVHALPSSLVVGGPPGAETNSKTWTLPSAAGRLAVADGSVADDVVGWDDLRFPAQGINPAGSSAPPAVDDVLTSFPGTLVFSGSQENVIAGVAQMPHSWKKGSAIRPHIHWSKTTGSSSAVSWVLYYRHLGFAGDVAGAWVGPIAGTIAEGSQLVTNEHLISSFGDVAMTGKKESSCLCWQLRREGNTDADSATARLYEFDIHFQVEKGGTATEIPA